MHVSNEKIVGRVKTSVVPRMFSHLQFTASKQSLEVGMAWEQG